MFFFVKGKVPPDLTVTKATPEKETKQKKNTKLNEWAFKPRDAPYQVTKSEAFPLFSSIMPKSSEV